MNEPTERGRRYNVWIDDSALYIDQDFTIYSRPSKTLPNSFDIIFAISTLLDYESVLCTI